MSGALKRVILPSGNEAIFSSEKTDTVEIIHYGVHVATKLNGTWRERQTDGRAAHLSDALRYERVPLVREYEANKGDRHG